MNNVDYVSISKNDKYVSVVFNIESDKVFDIGEKMSEINEEAYMNGYNWEVFFDYYLGEEAKDVKEGLNHDPEAGLYVGYYDLTEVNIKKAEKFMEIIIDLIEDEKTLYEYIENNGENIPWD